MYAKELTAPKIGYFCSMHRKIKIRTFQAFVLPDHALLHSDSASAIIRIMPYLHMRVWRPVLTSLEKEANLVYEDILSFLWK
jgi:hypothetical protein